MRFPCATYLPLYRQEAICWSRYRVWLPRQLLGQWVELASDWLRLIYEEIRRKVLAPAYVQIDETPIRYLAPGHGQTKLGRLWTCHRPGGDVGYSWQLSRAASCMEKIIPVDFRGRIQCDGYQGYDAFARARQAEIDLVGCWAHARRYFFQAKEQAPKPAGLILHLPQSLYRSEGRLRRTRAGPTPRALASGLEARPVIHRLQQALWLWKKQRRFLPKSLMGKAIDYALGQWDSLLPYLEDGRLEIDNTLVENDGREEKELALLR